jgi:hypothetical protein
MVTALATEKLFANACIESFIHMPAAGATEQSVKAGATATTWRAMRDYEGFAVIAVQGVLGGNGMIELSIYAATDNAASDAAEIKTTGTVACDAIGDYTCLEVSAEEIAQLGAAAGVVYTHVTAYIDSHHADDEQGVTYIRFGAKRPTSGLTAETISA